MRYSRENNTFLFAGRKVYSRLLIVLIARIVKMSYTILIDRAMYWHGNNWVRYEQSANVIVRVHYDQLFLCSGGKILESLNLTGKIRGFYKEDVLILVIGTGTEIRKIKFRIKTDVAECLRRLSLHFNIVNHGALHNVISSRYRTIEEVLKQAITETMGAEGRDTDVQLPPDFENFMKLCLLDPKFPEVVRRAQIVLEKL